MTTFSTIKGVYRKEEDAVTKCILRSTVSSSGFLFHDFFKREEEAVTSHSDLNSTPLGSLQVESVSVPLLA